MSKNARFFVFFEGKYFALLLAICHSKSRTHTKKTNEKSMSHCFIWTDDEVELLLKVCIEYKTSKTNDNTDCNVIAFESIWIRSYTSIRKGIGFKSQKFPDSQVGLTGCVWTKGVSGKKSLRIQKYPDTCVWGLTIKKIWRTRWISSHVFLFSRSLKIPLKCFSPTGTESVLFKL